MVFILVKLRRKNGMIGSHDHRNAVHALRIHSVVSGRQHGSLPSRLVFAPIEDDCRKDSLLENHESPLHVEEWHGDTAVTHSIFIPEG